MYPSRLGETDHKGHHEREQSRRFGERESQNGVPEQLTPQARIASHARDQAPEHRPDTDTGTCETDGRQPGTDVAAGDDEGFGELGGEGTDGWGGEGGGLEGVAGLLALQGLEGGFGEVVVGGEGTAHS